MKVLITGSAGFIGRNLISALRSSTLCSNQRSSTLASSLCERTDVEILPFDLAQPRADLVAAAQSCDFVFHLAGVNRPKDPAEFAAGNAVFTEDLLELLAPRAVPVLLSSSIQAALDNDYGRSKKAAEDAVFAYGRQTGAPVFVYRLANVFGKWSRPNYNSAVATWCHNVARDLPIQVRDPDATVTLVYVDDVVDAFLSHLAAPATGCDSILSVSPQTTRRLGEIVDLIKSFRHEPETLQVPDQRDDFARKLYATYLSFLPEDNFSYPLATHADARGSFTEMLRTPERGQVSVNVSRPGITKGQHWHRTKHEKFCVVSGRGLIRFRRIDEPGAPVLEYPVSGEKLEVVRIPPGYTHSIVNVGTSDLVTVMWANEPFDPERPDTMKEEV